LDLIFTLDTSTNWDFRWKDPSNGGNWISAIDSMIASGQIRITAPDGDSVVDQGGYTDIMGGVASVPGTSSQVLACIAAGGIMLGTEWRRRRRGR
jgi:hypothetical protein